MVSPRPVALLGEGVGEGVPRVGVGAGEGEEVVGGAGAGDAVRPMIQGTSSVVPDEGYIDATTRTPSSASASEP